MNGIHDIIKIAEKEPMIFFSVKNSQLAIYKARSWLSADPESVDFLILHFQLSECEK